MRFRLFACFVVIVFLLAGCNDGDGDFSLTILVTNDDGIGAPGIDTLVNALQEIPNVEVVVVAPDVNRMGASDKTTPGGVTYVTSATASGYEGTAVDGYPADCVIVALNELGITPDLVVSGINAGQNVGPFAVPSGTIGAAQTAARNGIPAVAVSAGFFNDSPSLNAAAELVVQWIEDNRYEVADGQAPTDVIVSFNVPYCTEGEIRELVTVPLADEYPEEGYAAIQSTDCSLEPSGAPVDDIDAMIKGYAAVTIDVPLYFD